MIDIMVMMMPLMKPFMWFSVIVFALGAVFIAMDLLFNKNNKEPLTWVIRIVFIASVFFIGAQVMGHFLNMPPTINFGDSSKFEFILVSFWQVGLVFLIGASILKLLGNISLKNTTET
jgi:hypothetical protein